MAKYLTIIFILIILISFDAKALTLQGTVKNLTCNVFEQPQTTSNIITSLPQNTKVTILETNLKKDWLKIKFNEITGWSKKDDININSKLNTNLELTTLFNIKNNELIVEPVKITSTNGFIYIIDKTKPNKILKFNENGDYLQEFNLNYKWIKTDKDWNDIVLYTENNYIYTNLNTKNSLISYDQDKNVIQNLINDGLVSINDLIVKGDTIYILEQLSKTIKVFNKDKLNKVIFLTHSQNPTKIEIDFINELIYVLDNTNFYDSFIINTDFLNVRKEPGIKSDIMTIIKGNSSVKVIEKLSKKVDDYEWSKIEVSKDKYGYIASKFLRKISSRGKIDVYDFNGSLNYSLSLKDTILNNIDRFRLYERQNLVRIINNIQVKDSTLYVSMVSSIDNTNNKNSSINLGTIGVSDGLFYFTPFIPIYGNENSKFSVLDNNIVVSKSDKTISILSKKGEYVTDLKLLKQGPTHVSLLGVNNNNLIVYDNFKRSIFIYDNSFNLLNEISLYTQPIIYKEILNIYSNLTTELNYNDVNILNLGKIESNKITYTSSLLFFEPNIKVNVGFNHLNELIVVGKGKAIETFNYIHIFDKNYRLIRTIKNVEEFFNFFPQDEKKLIQLQDVEINFDKIGYAYIKLKSKSLNKYILYRAIISSKEIKILDTVNLYEANINEVKKILRDNDGFIYCLTDTDLVIFNPLGSLVSKIEKTFNDLILNNLNEVILCDNFNIYKLNL